ncbi:MAG: phage late control D family protein [Myxococcales bacterium]|nr:phage late control D family protein [Myxococcales bacterium]
MALLAPILDVDHLASATVAIQATIGVARVALLPPASTALRSVSVTLDSDGLGDFSLDFEAGDTIGQALQVIDQSQLAVGAEVSIALGADGTSATLTIGEITSVGFEMSQGGASISVSGFDLRHRLRQGMYLRTFVDKDDLQIAEAICKERGLSVKVEKALGDTPPMHYIVRQGEASDFEFVHDRLDRIGYELAVDADSLVIRPPTPQPLNPFLMPSFTPKTVRSFNATHSAVEEIDGVVIIGRDKDKNLKIVGTAGTTSSLVPPQPRVLTLHRAVADVDSAKKMAAQELSRRKEQAMTASISVRGDATLVPGVWVQLSEVGPFSAAWRVRTATHRWSPGGGYTTDLSLRQEGD